MFKKRGEVKKYSGFFAQKKQLIATSTLIGTIVGAGMLGIPYVVSQAGLLYGLGLILILGFGFVLLYLMLGEVVLRTKEQHQIAGYAEKYLGPAGKRIMTLITFVSIYGALTAYLIGEGISLHAIFKVGSPLLYTLLFLVVGVLIVWRGVKSTGKAELYLIMLLLIVVVIIGFYSLDKIEKKNLTVFNPTNFFLPYGIILFSLLGFAAIPEMQEELGNDKKLMKKSIIIGAIIPIMLYVLLTFIVVGMIGEEKFAQLEPNERIATIALGIFSHPILAVFANVLAVLAMFTSFLSLSTALIEFYKFDYHLPHTIAVVITFLLPLIVVLLKVTSFIAILALTGGIAGGLEGIVIIMMYIKAKKMGDRVPEYKMNLPFFVLAFLISLFALAIVYEIGHTLLV